jgi:FtsH-binding integral membrane protein
MQENNPSSDLKEARKRSVDNLQRLYTVVVSLAVTEILKRLLINEGKSASYKEWLMFVSLIFTLVPFYHGANRYLDATYVTGERSAKHHALMVDFIMLFLEGLLFFGLAMVTANESLFYTVLAVLFLLDIIWVGSTNLTATRDEDKMKGYVTWAGINCIALIALLLFVWSNLLNWEFWSSDLAKSIALVGVAIIRTVFDYVRVWKFYYPADDDLKSDNIPAPAPAPLPKKQD